MHHIKQTSKSCAGIRLKDQHATNPNKPAKADQVCEHFDTSYAVPIRL
jgi:hypothetical protein